MGGMNVETLNTFYDDSIGLSAFVQQHHNKLFAANSRAVLVQIFSGRYEQAFLTQLSAEIHELIPHASIIGTTTSGEIMNGQVSGLRTVLSFSIFNHSTVNCGFFPKSGQDDFELGRSIALKLGSDQSKILILYATGLTINAQEILLGIQSLYPRLPVSGGNAGNNSLTEQSFLICDDQILDSGVVGVVLEGEMLHVTCYSHLAWQPIGKEMTITKVDGLRVYTIDDIPAYEIYRKYLGLDERKNFFNVIEYPLITKRNEIEIARTPHTHYEDDSIRFAAELIKGEKVRLSFGNIERITEAMTSLCKIMKQRSVESIYIYSCESRRGFLQELSTIETEPLQEIAPVAGFFTYGEFFHDGDKNQLLNATMTVVVLSENEFKIRPQLPVTLIKDKEQREICSSYIDNVVKRNIGVLKSLTHLVNTVTAELVAANEQLEYISLHDSLTGLYNRTHFEQKMKYFDSLDVQVGIIVCDLDCLKMLNDVLGHDAGDKILRLASDILSKSCLEDNIIARIGGDEFVILVANAELSLLEDICNRILSEVAKTKSLKSENLLYLSIGYALKGEREAKNMEDAFKQADANMYRNKLASKTKVREDFIRSLIELTGENYRHLYR